MLFHRQNNGIQQEHIHRENVVDVRYYIPNCNRRDWWRYMTRLLLLILARLFDHPPLHFHFHHHHIWHEIIVAVVAVVVVQFYVHMLLDNPHQKRIFVIHLDSRQGLISLLYVDVKSPSTPLFLHPIIAHDPGCRR